MLTQVWFDEMAALSSDDDGDGLDHITECHDENRALCGTDVTDSDWYDGDAELPCVVCEDLKDFHCGCDCGCCDGEE